MSRVAPLFSWQRALTSDASDATRTERHVGLQVSLYMSAAAAGAWPGNSRLAAETLLGKSTVRDALRGLDAKGWLIRSINRGRGRSNDYEARIPRTYFEALSDDEKRQILAVFGLERVAAEGPEAEALRAALRASSDPSDEADGTAGKRQQTALFAGADREKTARPGAENRQDPVSKTASPLAPTSTEDQIRTNAAASELAATIETAAAAELEQRLRELRAGTRLRLVAHADPQRALAWIDVAETEASRNPAGFVMAGLKSGEWPSQRTPTSTSTSSRTAWLETTARQLGADLAHDIVDGWDDLDPGELAQWHQALDELFAQPDADDERAEGAA